jgi:hypothetical protein
VSAALTVVSANGYNTANGYNAGSDNYPIIRLHSTKFHPV